MYSFYHTIGVHVLISVWRHFRAISGTHVHHPNIPIVVSLDFFFFFFLRMKIYFQRCENIKSGIHVIL